MAFNYMAFNFIIQDGYENMDELNQLEFDRLEQFLINPAAVAGKIQVIGPTEDHNRVVNVVQQIHDKIMPCMEGRPDFCSIKLELFEVTLNHESCQWLNNMKQHIQKVELSEVSFEGDPFLLLPLLTEGNVTHVKLEETFPLENNLDQILSILRCNTVTHFEYESDETLPVNSVRSIMDRVSSTNERRTTPLENFNMVVYTPGGQRITLNDSPAIAAPAAGGAAAAGADSTTRLYCSAVVFKW